VPVPRRELLQAPARRTGAALAGQGLDQRQGARAHLLAAAVGHVPGCRRPRALRVPRASRDDLIVRRSQPGEPVARAVEAAALRWRGIDEWMPWPAGCPRHDSNVRLLPPEGSALSTELRGRGAPDAQEPERFPPEEEVARSNR